MHLQHNIQMSTALHSDKDFAPTLFRGRSPDCSVGTVSAGLNRVISVRTSRIAPGRRYPATLLRGRGPDCNVGAATLVLRRHMRYGGLNVRTFLCRVTPRLLTAAIRHQGHYMLKYSY